MSSVVSSTEDFRVRCTGETRMAVLYSLVFDRELVQGGLSRGSL